MMMMMSTRRHSSTTMMMFQKIIPSSRKSSCYSSCNINISNKHNSNNNASFSSSLSLSLSKRYFSSNYNNSAPTLKSAHQQQTHHLVSIMRSNNIMKQHTSVLSSAQTFINKNHHQQQQQQQYYYRSFSTSTTTITNTTTLSLTHKKRRNEKITMITAYDYPSSIHVARANIDIVLIGDSLGMVELGYETTQPVTINDIIHHCKAVKNGINLVINERQQQISQQISQQSNNTEDNENNKEYVTPLLIGDMPFGTYEYNNVDIALQNAYRIIKETNIDAIKLEGGCIERCKTIKHLINSGIAVMGHVGLLPQHISVTGGFRAQGRTALRARQLLDESLMLQDAGCFALVLECIPSNVAKVITENLEIPVIGIGAGQHTDGQVLVYHDLLGMISHPHHKQFVPKFCKSYASLGHIIQNALSDYKNDVISGEFPSNNYSPYKMSKNEQKLLDELLNNDIIERNNNHETIKKKLIQTDEYEQLSLYGNNTNNITNNTSSSDNNDSDRDSSSVDSDGNGDKK